MAWTYSAFGLTLSANRRISQLKSCAAVARPDVQVHLEESAAWPAELFGLQVEDWYTSDYCNEQGEPGFVFRKVAGGASFWLRYCDGVEFLLNSTGTDVRVSWPASRTLQDALSYLCGPILGIVLRLQGIACLHASAVLVEEKAMLFVGEAGAGKSTLAATFARLGHSVLTDDVVALTLDERGVCAHPGSPRIRLWPDAAEALTSISSQESSDLALEQVSGSQRKHLNLLQSGHLFQQSSVPVGKIYFLGARCHSCEATEFNSITPAEACLTLVANSYATRFLNAGSRSAEFMMFQKLLAQAAICRMRVRDDATKLESIYQAICEDAAATFGTRLGKTLLTAGA